MKKLISVILSLLLLLSLCGCGNEENTDKKKPTTSSGTTQANSDVDAATLDDGTTDSYDDGTATVDNTNLGDDGASDSSDESAEDEVHLKDTLQGGVNFSCLDEGTNAKSAAHYVYDRKYYDKVVEAGFDHIRLPVGFGRLVTTEGPEYLLDLEALRYVDTAINHGLDAGLVVVLDNHHGSGYEEPEKFKRVWEQLAERYQFYPEELMFELVNEPSPELISNGKLNELQIETVEIIRKTNPTRTIALASNDANGVWNLWNVQVPGNIEDGVLVPDPNIMISIHMYNPMKFTHQGMNGHPTNQHWKEEYKKLITDDLEVCADYEKRTGRTVWVSEWGCYQGGHPDVAKCMPNYYKHFTKECARLDISYAVWEFNAGFGIFDKNAGESGEFRDYLIKNMIIEW